MAAYSSEKCWQLWKQEALTAEQAIGQLLQLVAALEAQVKEIEQRLRVVEAARQAYGKVGASPCGRPQGDAPTKDLFSCTGLTANQAV